jgi:hypothetical protein
MKKLLITFLLILLTSCDYSPIYSTEDSKFRINEIKTTGNKKINKIFIKKITKFKNNSSNIIYDLEVSSSKIVRSITKDERGKTKILEMIISFNINIKRNDKILKNKNISNNFSYNNNSNKFELNQYEKDIQNKMIEKIVEELLFTVKTL